MNKDVLKKGIVDFLQADTKKLAAISTVDGERPEVAFVYYSVDADVNIYFVTRTGSRKYQNILKNQRVAFAVVSEDPAKTVQIEGMATLVIEPGLQEKLFPRLVELAVSRNLFPPISQYAKTTELAFMKITPVWARFSDFTLSDEQQKVRELSFNF